MSENWQAQQGRLQHQRALREADKGLTGPNYHFGVQFLGSPSLGVPAAL